MRSVLTTEEPESVPDRGKSDEPAEAGTAAVDHHGVRNARLLGWLIQATGALVPAVPAGLFLDIRGRKH